VTERKIGFVSMGVVFRGNRWMDGVICNLELKGQDLVSTISTTIRHSKQYSQLHAIILAKQELFSSRELAELASSVSIPVIAILTPYCYTQSRVKAWADSGYYKLRVGGKHILVLAIGFDKEEAERILAVSCNPSTGEPEAVRVAELIVKSAQSLQFTK